MTNIPIICRVQALYSFQSNDSSSLSFEKDDMIDVLNKLPSGWWDGLCNGTRGWFPSNYVKILKEPYKENKNEYRLSLSYNNQLISNQQHYYEDYLIQNQDLPYMESTVDLLQEYEDSDVQTYSDQSTLPSMEDKPFRMSALPSKQSHHFNDNQSINSSIESYQPISRPLSRISSIEQEPISWTKILNSITTPIYQLIQVAKHNQCHLYTKYANEIVDNVRYMLMSSSTIDKDSVHIKTNAILRTQHRAMIANMSKLVLSAQTCQYIFFSDDEQQSNTIKILSEANELLASVKGFTATCQNLKLPLMDTEPHWVESTESEQHQTKYTLQISLAESLETMGSSVQELAKTIRKCIALHLKSDSDRASLAAVLFTHFRNLSNQIGFFLGYLDDTDFTLYQHFVEYEELSFTKQILIDNLGLLFFKLQDITNESLIDFNSYLVETDHVVSILDESIETIYESVLILASKKSRSNSTASFSLPPSITSSSIVTDIIPEEEPIVLQRHQSELPPHKDTVMPYPMQRSQTVPAKLSNTKLKKFFGNDTPLPDSASVSTASQSLDEQPEYLKYDYGPNDIVFNMEGSVKGGTLSALVERLTLHDYLDMNFINTFLLTYRSFCSSEKLLDLLEARYNLPCPEGLVQDEVYIWEEKKLKLIRLRVFNVLKNWLDLYYNEDDSVLLDRLLEFTQTHIKTTLKFSKGQLESLIERRRLNSDTAGLKKMVLTFPDPPPPPILPKNKRRFKLLDLDPLEMARQLTIMDFKLYSAIRPIECLDKAWSGDEEGNVAINIRASIEYCNQVTSWVSDVILSQNDIKKRSIIIKFWVQVAEKCRILNNFNTCMAILSAFDNSSVGRLKRTWEAVGARTNQTLQQIRKLMGANRNFNEYRAIIHSINPPCIPFLGIYLQDLTFIEDGNPSTLKNNKDLINFGKCAKTAEVIREIQQYQSSLYHLKSVEEIQQYIKTFLDSTRDEEQLYMESLKIEPRECEDEKITRLLQESGFL